MINKIKNNKKCKIGIIGIGVLLVLLIAYMLINNFNVFRPSLEKIKDSVVMVEVYNRDNELISTGSGFCAYKNNYIVTNFHVIEGGYSFKVVGDDKKIYKVKKIVVFNKKDDLAIIEINGKLDKLKINGNAKLSVKDKVTAIGSPKGELNTVSEGIISNIDDKDLIRISVPISHGSSGGVLLNSKYEVVGITNAGYDDADSLNFAIRAKKLDKMYKNFKNGNYDTIDASNYKDCAPNIINFNTQNQLRIKNKCSFSNLNDYTVNSFDTFNLATDSYEIFNTAMYKIKALNTFSDNYKKLSKEEQILASEYYTELLKYEDCDANNKVDCSIDNISNWNKEQMIMELDIMETYALAIFEIEIGKCNSNNVFSYIDSLPLRAPEKGILLLLYGGYSPRNLSNNDAKKIIEYVKNLNLSVDEKGKILSYLGYTVYGSNVNW